MARVKSGITQEELIAWGGQEVFNQALPLCSADILHDIVYDDETLWVSGKLRQSGGWDMDVRFHLEPNGRIRSECPCYANREFGRVCPHVVAVGIGLMTTEMDDEPRPAKVSPAAEDGELAQTEGDFIEVPMKPRFYAEIHGSRASLSIDLDAYYGPNGEIDFPVCSQQGERTVYLPDPDDDQVRRTRSIEDEKAAVDELVKWGFTRGYDEKDLRVYLTDGHRQRTFLGSGLPSLRRLGWKLELDQDLERMVDEMPTVVPVVKVRDAPDGNFDVCISFDAQGVDIPPAEIQAAINRGDGYIMRDGRPVLLDRTAINSIHEVFGDCEQVRTSRIERGWSRIRGVYAPYVKSSLDQFADLIELEDARAERWHREADRRNDRNPEARFEPVSLGPLDRTLRPYQKQGVYWMRFLEESGLCGLLADEMGLGKTLQTLTWLSLPRSDGAKAPALIVCPTSLVRNWQAEAQKFTPWLKVLVLSGPDRTADFVRIDDSDVVVTSYALLQRDLETAYLGREFSAMVIDEAQHIKNRTTKNALAVKAVNARRRLALTGTPIENSVGDAWSIFDYLMPEYLGDYTTFTLKYGVDAPTANLQQLKRKLHPFIMRRVKKTVARDLPDKIVKVSYCPMSDDAQREYVAALSKVRCEAGGMVRRKGFAKSKFEILAMLMKLRQIAARAKVEPFMEQLTSAVESGHKILVFSQFVKMLKTLGEELDAAHIPYCYLDGSTKDRLGECNRFNRDPKLPVFLISLMAGGTGLNLTGADMVMHYDPWWNPAVEDQATDRAHRIGQKKTVYVIKMIASGSIEEKVLALQRRKQAIIAATVDTTDAAVMEKLTAADLEELLS